MKESAAPKLDNLDITLVKELELDALQTNYDLAIKLGTSPTTVRRRIANLLQEKLIDIVAIIDPVSLGFHTRAFLGLTVRPGMSDAVANDLQQCENVYSMTLNTGRFDILLYVVFRDQIDMLNFVEKRLSLIPGLTHAETMMVLKRVKSSWTYLQSKTGSTEQTMPHPLSEIELKMIREVQLNPRADIKDLSKKLGISRRTVSSKMRLLMDTNILRVVSVVNPPAFGFHIRAAIFIKTALGQIDKVVDLLMADGRITNITIITGGFNLVIWGNFRELAELSDFLKNVLGKIEGVTYHETTIELEALKRFYRLS